MYTYTDLPIAKTVKRAEANKARPSQQVPTHIQPVSIKSQQLAQLGDGCDFDETESAVIENAIKI